MASHPLPLIDPARTEFGFSRTVCACHECTHYCRHLPGFLVPADLDRLQQHLAPSEELRTWARRRLLASPGALVLRRGQVVRILTLVPARRPDGACRFLTDAAQCAIHAVSPFGCAFFDAHLPPAEADRRSQRGLQAVLEAREARGPYARLWASHACAQPHSWRAFATQRLVSVLNREPVARLLKGSDLELTKMTTPICNWSA